MAIAQKLPQRNHSEVRFLKTSNNSKTPLALPTRSHFHKSCGLWNRRENLNFVGFLFELEQQRNPVMVFGQPAALSAELKNAQKLARALFLNPLKREQPWFAWFPRARTRDGGMPTPFAGKSRISKGV